MENYKFSHEEQEKLNVLKYQKQILNEAEIKFNETAKIADEAIESSELLLREFGIDSAEIKNQSKNIQMDNKKSNIKIKSWNALVNEAESQINGKALITDILTEDEIKNVEEKIGKWRVDFNEIHKLDEIDWAICGVAGLLAAAVDIFLIGMPQSGLGGTKGGPLSNYIRDKINSSLPENEIRNLEKKYWVPFDPANNSKLEIPVEGLSTYFHRYQSLGHDPILGFIFGVLDVMNGTFTAIDKNGKLILQTVANQETVGMSLFEAIGRVFGHMKSDVATPMGLPAPLMPLFNLLQFGSIGEEKSTIADIARSMYGQGYDFRHFLSMSISPLIIEVIVRFSYFAKRKLEGNSFSDSIPIDLGANKKPKLRTMLFTAHLISTAANAGKVGVTQNPLAINYLQWIALFRYLIPQLKWVLHDKEEQRGKYVEKKLSEEWETIDKELDDLWKKTIENSVILN